jgi:soluble lytic murein transglycosylase-like protein
MYRWKQDEDGRVLVADLPDGPWHAPVLAPADAKVLEAIEGKWGAICRAAAAKHGLPDGWLQAHIYRESGGNARAFRQERDQNGVAIMRQGRPLTGIGLLQITSPELKSHWRDEQLYDPATNLDIGAAYMATLAKRYDFDFPKVAAAYNAGSVRVSSANPWGMVQTTGHVSSEVAALNTWLGMATLKTMPLSEQDKAQVLASVWATSDQATDSFAFGSPLPSEEPTEPSEA